MMMCVQKSNNAPHHHFRSHPPPTATILFFAPSLLPPPPPPAAGVLGRCRLPGTDDGNNIDCAAHIESLTVATGSHWGERRLLSHRRPAQQHNKAPAAKEGKKKKKGEKKLPAISLGIHQQHSLRVRLPFFERESHAPCLFRSFFARKRRGSSLLEARTQPAKSSQPASQSIVTASVNPGRANG